MTKIQKILNTLGLVFITLALTVGCSTIDVQDTRDMEEFERHYKSCDKWVTISSEAWMECMMLRPDTTLVPTMEIHTTTHKRMALMPLCHTYVSYLLAYGIHTICSCAHKYTQIYVNTYKYIQIQTNTCE